MNFTIETVSSLRRGWPSRVIAHSVREPTTSTAAVAPTRRVVRRELFGAAPAAFAGDAGAVLGDDGGGAEGDGAGFTSAFVACFGASLGCCGCPGCMGG